MDTFILIALCVTVFAAGMFVEALLSRATVREAEHLVRRCREIARRAHEAALRRAAAELDAGLILESDNGSVITFRPRDVH